MSKDNCLYMNVNSSFVHKCQQLETAKCPSPGEWINQLGMSSSLLGGPEQNTTHRVAYATETCFSLFWRLGAQDRSPLQLLLPRDEPAQVLPSSCCMSLACLWVRGSITVVGALLCPGPIQAMPLSPGANGRRAQGSPLGSQFLHLWAAAALHPCVFPQVHTMQLS